MTVYTKVGYFSSPGGTGNQTTSWTDTMNFVPQVLFVWGSQAVTDGADDSLDCGFWGAAVSSSNRFCHSWNAEDGVPTSDTGKNHSTSELGRQGTFGTQFATEHVFDFVSFGDNQFTVNWSDLPSITMKVMFMAIGGLDNVGIGTFQTGTSSGNVSDTDVGFKGNTLWLSSSSLTTLGTSSANGAFSLGIWDDGRNGAAWGMFNADADATPQGDGQWDMDCNTTVTFEILSGITTVGASATLASYDTTGITVNFAVGPSASYHCSYVALLCANSSLVQGITRTTNGTTAYTGFGMEPDCAFTLGEDTSATADSSSANLGYWHIGGSANPDTGSGVGQGIHYYYSNTDPSLCGTFWQDGDLDAMTQGDVSAWGTDGFTINYKAVTGTAYKSGLLGLKGYDLPDLVMPRGV